MIFDISLFLTTIFMTISWNTFEHFNGELLDISESFNIIIKLYLKEYITYDMFKAELALKNIPYQNQEYYEHLIDTFCAQLKNVTRISMDVYPELINENYQKKYEELLWCSIRKSFINYIIGVAPSKDTDIFCNIFKWIFTLIFQWFLKGYLAQFEEFVQSEESNLIKNISLVDIFNDLKDKIINWIKLFFCGY